MLSYTAIRKKLEENYTHVTFVRHCSITDTTVWYIYETMKEIRVPDTSKLEEILPRLEAQIVFDNLKVINPRALEKVAKFERAMTLGVVPCNHRIYKRYTLAQLTILCQKAKKPIK